jgi:hypothetical protein
MTATSTDSLATLFSISLNRDWSLSFTFNPWIIGLVVIACVVIVYVWRRVAMRQLSNFEIDEAEVGIGTGTISFKPNLRDQEIAYKIWVELSTRKIGLPIDLEHDVIAEIYDSWHTFFTITRELIKDIPVSKVKNESTRKIITLSINVLNEGLRPHLTTWQARFRHWYERQLKKEEGDFDPQTIQAKYPQFADLKKDLLTVNQRLMKYREKMKELVLGITPDARGGENIPPPETPSL